VLESADAVVWHHDADVGVFLLLFLVIFFPRLEGDPLLSGIVPFFLCIESDLLLFCFDLLFVSSESDPLLCFLIRSRSASRSIFSASVDSLRVFSKSCGFDLPAQVVE
jgi:hypothetical protein